jgi:hypothetical protein
VGHRRIRTEIMARNKSLLRPAYRHENLCVTLHCELAI